MKTPFFPSTPATLALTILAFGSSFATTLAQGTAFTYQGRLTDGGIPATGIYDFRFVIYDALAGGAQQANALTNATTGVTNGLFTVTLDFGAGVFNGAPRWLDVSVHTNGAGSFTFLAPRQPLTPAPYAITAGNLMTGGLASGIYGNAVTFSNAANHFTGVFTGNGASVTNVNAATLGGLRSSDFWKLGGNSGANPASGNFLGTADNLPLEFKVNGVRVLRLEPTANGAPNLIGGSFGNSISNGVAGATISGGGTLDYYGNGPSTNQVTADYGTVGGGTGNTAGGGEATVSGGLANAATGSSATIGGGVANIASGTEATVGGGEANVADGPDATIGGGNNNSAYGQASTVSGGDDNAVFNFAAAIGGGWQNVAANQYSTVPGGYQNTAAGDYAFAAGQRAKANHTGTFVWADSQAADFTSTSSNQFLIRAKNGVGIGNNDPQAPLHVSGGGDAGLAAGGNFISGLVSGQNIVMDNNEIISRNNGAASDLILNFGSGNVGIGRNPAANRLEVAGDASKATAGNWLANSDARIKTDVQTVTNAIERLSQVRLVKFHYTADYLATHPEVASREYFNVIAQEFQKVFPQDVTPSGETLSNGDHILQVDTYPLTIYSAAAIQELNRKLDNEVGNLQTELRRRDAENAELKRRVEALEHIVRSQTPE